MPDRADVEQRGVCGWIDEDVQIAAFVVAALRDRSEHARIAGAVGFDDLADRGAMQVQGFGRFHGFPRFCRARMRVDRCGVNG